MQIREVFARNLRHLTAGQNAAAIARALDMSPQQLNALMSGSNYPRERTLVRLGRFFGVEETDLFDPDFAARRSAGRACRRNLVDDLSGDARMADLPEGRYDLYFSMAEESGHLVRALVLVRRYGEVVTFRRVLRFHVAGHPDWGYYRSDHRGVVLAAGGAIFMTGINMRPLHEPSLVTLEQAATGAFYSGIALLTSMIGPFVAPAVMVRNMCPSIRDALRRAHIVAIDEPETPSVVRDQLGSRQARTVRRAAAGTSPA